MKVGVGEEKNFLPPKVPRDLAEKTPKSGSLLEVGEVTLQVKYIIKVDKEAE
ncbi:MAG: hypothetical protein JW969_15715 [Spirochaetales bacterium]|nr:hypothetical protein [Spirochaetales bacterium]